MRGPEREGATPAPAGTARGAEIVLRKWWQQALLVAGVLLAALIGVTLPFWRG